MDYVERVYLAHKNYPTIRDKVKEEIIPLLQKNLYSGSDVEFINPFEDIYRSIGTNDQLVLSELYEIEQSDMIVVYISDMDMGTRPMIGAWFELMHAVSKGKKAMVLVDVEDTEVFNSILTHPWLGYFGVRILRYQNFE